MEAAQLAKKDNNKAGLYEAACQLER